MSFKSIKFGEIMNGVIADEKERQSENRAMRNANIMLVLRCQMVEMQSKTRLSIVKLPDQWERQSIDRWTSVWKQLQVEIGAEKKTNRALRSRGQGTLTLDWEGQGRLFPGSGIQG